MSGYAGRTPRSAADSEDDRLDDLMTNWYNGSSSPTAHSFQDMDSEALERQEDYLVERANQVRRMRQGGRMSRMFNRVSYPGSYGMGLQNQSKSFR